MAEPKDTSLLFSLKALEELENERVDREARERREAEQARARARAEKERRQAEQAWRRRRAAEAEQRAAAARDQEERLRLEAIQRAHVEQARLDAEARARTEATRIEKDHDRALEKIREGSRTRRYQWLFWSASGFVLLLGVAAALMYTRLEQEAQLRAEQREVLALARDQGSASQRLLEAARKRVDGLRAELEALREQKADEPGKAAPTPPRPPKAQSTPKSKTPSSTRKQPRAAPRKCGNDGDPLNECLPR